MSLLKIIILYCDTVFDKKVDLRKLHIKNMRNNKLNEMNNKENEGRKDEI